MIDWARVTELCDEIGVDDFVEVVELFLAEVETGLALLVEGEGNPVATGEQMHFLKGASLNLGFAQMADLCARGEKLANDGDITTVSPGEVQDCFAASRKIFEAELPDRLAA